MKRILLFFVVLCTFLSCDTSLFGRSESILFAIPQHNTYSSIMYIDTNGDVKIIHVAGTMTTVSIPIHKNRLTPILLYESNIDERTFGCIYPHSTTFDSYGGFSAWILYRLMISSEGNKEDIHTYASHFNWTRFTDHIKKYNNPWVLNQDLILENIADRTFNVYSIKEK